MLIVVNGAYKSGSTWLYNITAELMTGFGAPPKPLLHPDWKEPSIRPERLTDALNALQPQDRWLVKNHFPSRAERAALLAHPEVRVLDIRRDLRDVVVSSYYYDRRRLGFTGSFDAYYWAIGRGFARKVCLYHAVWETPPSAQCFCASYEGLLTDFAGEVGRLAAFLGVSVTPERVEAIRQATSLHALRERYGEKDKAKDDDNFFRKGTTGDYANHMNRRMLLDLARIEWEVRLKFSAPYRALQALKRRIVG